MLGERRLLKGAALGVAAVKHARTEIKLSASFRFPQIYHWNDSHRSNVLMKSR